MQSAVFRKRPCRFGTHQGGSSLPRYMQKDKMSVKIVKRKRFDSFAQEMEFDFVVSQIHPDSNFAVELYENQMIVKLNIPFSEIFCRCTPDQWSKLKGHIKSTGGNVK